MKPLNSSVFLGKAPIFPFRLYKFAFVAFATYACVRVYVTRVRCVLVVVPLLLDIVINHCNDFAVAGAAKLRQKQKGARNKNQLCMKWKANNKYIGAREHQASKDLPMCGTVRELFISHLIQLSCKQCIFALRIFGGCSGDYRYRARLQLMLNATTTIST